MLSPTGCVVACCDSIKKDFLWSAVKTSVLKTHNFGKKAQALEAGGEGEELSGESSRKTHIPGNLHCG